MAKYYYKKYNSNLVTEYSTPITYTSYGPINRGSSYTYTGYTDGQMFWTSTGGWGTYYGATEGNQTVDSSNTVGVALYSIDSAGRRTKQTAQYTSGTVYESGQYEDLKETSHYEKGSYITELIADDGDYPDDGRHTDGYWYVKGVAAIKPAVSTVSPATNVTYESAIISGQVTSVGSDNPRVYMQWGESISDNEEFIGTGGVGSYSKSISDLDPNTTYLFRIKAVNNVGTVYGNTESFETLEMPLAAPVKNSPATGTETTDRTPTFDFTLTAESENDATKYHARLRLSKVVGISPVEFTYESKESTGTWEYWTGSIWATFPTLGVTPGTRVRCTIVDNLVYRQDYYWDVASWDGSIYGFNSSAWKIRAVIDVDGLFLLEIDGTSWDVFSLVVTETSNGELGSIVLSVNNKNGAAYTNISYGDEVVLAINDLEGNTEEFGGVVREKNPKGDIMIVGAILGDGILAERLVNEDYSSQDIGLILKDIIDDYCSPLSSSGIDTSLSLTAPYPGKNITPLRIFEDLRRRYGFFYYVDADWKVQAYLKEDITPTAFTEIRYGD